MASEDQAKVLEEARKLSYIDRVAHKVWAVRAAAFEDIGTACKASLDPESPIFTEVGTLFVKGISDANANVPDKALDALHAYLENTSERQAERIATVTCSTIAAKVLKGRPGTVKRAADACLAFVEWEQVDAVLEPLFKAFGDKVPKAVVSALDIVTQAFSLFGPKVVKPQPIAKALPSLFEAKQEPVREGVKKLAVELSAWLGVDYVQGSLCGKMPDLMRKDVEKLMEERPPSKKQPERFTRKEQAARAAAAEAAAAADPSNSVSPDAGVAIAAGAMALPGEDANDMDSYEYAEPVDIQPSLNKEFWEGLTAKKWSERRDALQKFKSLASQPRLAPGDFGDVLRELRKIILKDSNVVCAGEAILCIGALAKSLRSNFASSARSFVSVILEKYKDPKTSIGTAVTDSLIHIHKYCLPLPDLADDFVASLTHKNPKIKVDSAKLLQACIDSSNKKDAAKAQATLLPVAVKAANDPAPDVREANMGVLVAFAVKAGNMALLDKVSGSFEESRKKRLNELAQQRSGGAKPAVAIPALSSKSSILPRSPAAPAVTRVPNTRSTAADKPASSRPGLSKLPSKKATVTSAPSGPADDDDAALAGGALSESEAKEKMMELLGEEIVSGLQNPMWKERLTSMDTMLEKVKGMDDVSLETASILIQGVAYLPGWSEKNFQVLGKAFEVITRLVSASSVSKKDAFAAIGGLVDKMSDIKLKAPAGDALFAISEALGPQFVFTQLHKKAASHKNPKVLSETITWMARAVDDFGLATLKVGALIDWTKGDLASTNAAVRNAAIHLMATCHKQLGPGLASMIRADVKPALMTALEDSFRNSPQQQVVPTRTVRSSKPKKATAAANGTAVPQDDSKSAPAAFDPEELLPRMDISGQLGSKVITSLGSSNWKERNHTMDDLENIIKSAARIEPNIGDLIPSLKARLTDSNKNLVARALILFGELAKAMGPAWERVGRPVLSQAVTFLADNKKQVRDAALVALDAWVGSAPADKVLPAAVEFLGGAKASSEGKVTGLRWIAGVVEAKKATRCLDVVLKAAATASGDKAVEVREAASILAAIISQVYPGELAAALDTLPAAVKKSASDLLGKVPSTATNGHASHAPSQSQSTISASAEPQPSTRSKEAGGARAVPRPSPLRTSQTKLPGSAENSVPNTPSKDGPCLHYSSKKDERTGKARFKSSKFEPPREYEAEELEEELGSLVSEPFRRLLFATDFKRHMEAADILLSQLDGLQREVMSCMDLILRWIVLRICDANTQCLLKALDLTKALFALMIEQEYQLTDGEAHSILPCIIEKSGHNQDRLRQYTKELIRMGGKLVSLPRMVEYLMQGLRSKNNRTRVDCVDLLGELLEEEGLAACESNKLKPFAAMAQLVTERDQALRSAVLGALEILYRHEGSATVWTHVGRLTDQQRSLIEERFKFAAKQAAKMQHQRPAVPSSHALEHSAQSVAPTPELPRLASANERPKGRPGINLDALQSIPFPPSVLTSTPSLDEAVVSRRGHVQYPPETPPAQRYRTAQPGASIPTPLPGKTPATGAPSPPPADIVRLEIQDDEEIHDLFTEALLMLADENHSECVEGAKRICYVLQHASEGRTTDAFLKFLSQSATELIKALTTKVDEVFDWVLEEAVSTGKPANPRPCKYTINALMMAFDVEGMTRTVPVDDLRDLMFVLLARLLDTKIHHMLAHQPQIMRALNVLMFKIMGNNFGNGTLDALLQLLMVSKARLQQRNLEQAEFTALITKCLIRCTKHLHEKYERINVRDLVLSLHHFFTSLGVDEIRRRGAREEKSLKVVKTLVHELCRITGEDIREQMQDIPRDTDPIPLIHVYVDLHLESLHDAGLIDPTETTEPSSARSNWDTEFRAADAQQHNRSMSLQSLHSRSSSLQSSLNFPTAVATITQRSSKDLKASISSQPNAKETLLPILQRIGDGSTSERGLEDLHKFMKEHPEVDTKPFLNRLSKDFHSFVEKGLQRMERRNQASERLSTASSVTSQDSLANGHHVNAATGEHAVHSLGSRLGGLRLSSQSPREGIPTMNDVEDMQERMRSLRRIPNI